MRKQVLQALLATSMVAALGLFGCGAAPSTDAGGNTEEAVVSEEPGSPEEAGGAVKSGDAEEEECRSVEFEDLVIFENEDMTIWLERIYEEPPTFRSADRPGIHMEVRVRNNSEHLMDMYFYDGYVGDEAVDIVNASFSIKAGKNETGYLEVVRELDPDYIPLESLDDIYNLEFTVYYALEDEASGYYVDQPDADIYFADVVPRS